MKSKIRLLFTFTLTAWSLVMTTDLTGFAAVCLRSSVDAAAATEDCCCGPVKTLPACCCDPIEAALSSMEEAAAEGIPIALAPVLIDPQSCQGSAPDQFQLGGKLLPHVTTSIASVRQPVNDSRLSFHFMPTPLSADAELPDKIPI